MNKIKFLVTIILIFTFPAASFSQGSDPKELFSQDTQRYIAKDYKEAKKLLSQALEIEPNNTEVLTNLALAEFQLGQKALAAGLLRKALHIERDLSAAQLALAFDVLREYGVARRALHQVAAGAPDARLTATTVESVR